MFQTGNPLLDRALELLPGTCRGPGGAIAVLREGRVLARHAWGHADLDRRIAMTPDTVMPICSISKEFTCGLLLDLVGDPARLDPALAACLPEMAPRPSVAELCHNQSGLRDYWALTVLCGARPEGRFAPAQSRDLLGRLRTTHFAPGSRYSYSNGNFRILGELVERHADRPLGQLLRDRLFKPAGMATARLNPDTGDLPGHAVGYEGTVAAGFRPAVNRIHWEGDAGICATLDDMIAWERFVDATRDDADGLYRRLSAPTTFSDGARAVYGYGLAHVEIGGVEATGHGGALRGWRHQRLHVAAERLSVVVMFNHQADAYGAAQGVMLAALGLEAPAPEHRPPDPSWFGHYLDDETGLTLGLGSPDGTRLAARFATVPELMDVQADGTARSKAMVLRRTPDGIRLERPTENLATELRPIGGEAAADIEGRFHNAELDADFVCSSLGGALYGAFDGFLGQGPAQAIYPVAPDIWLLPCPRAMDAPAPGDWTLLFERDAQGAVARVTIGCWLARKIVFERR